jgi:taurine dioxygenase
MFEVNQLRDSEMGIQVIGLKPDDLSDEETRAELRRLWIDKGLIVFRDLEGPDVQIALSEVFGPCIGHPMKPKDGSTDWRLITVQCEPGEAQIWEVDGVQMAAWLPWHSDLVYVDKINHGGILRPLVVPEKGGETGFLDKIALYDDLPKYLKDKISGMHVAYKYDIDVARWKFSPKPSSVARWSKTLKEVMSRADNYPKVLHPMTFKQPETGRTILNISPWFALGIDGMENEEGDALLRELINYIVEYPRPYFHKYEPNDMVLFDNWRVLHCATGILPDASRVLQRTTIDGDYALGRRQNENEVIDDRIRVNI